MLNNQSEVSPSSSTAEFKPFGITLHPQNATVDIEPISLRVGRATIGASSACDVIIPVEGIANQHCLLMVGRRRTIVKALSPMTWINDGSVSEGTLNSGDRLILGPVEFLVEENPCSARSAEAPTTAETAQSPAFAPPNIEELLLAAQQNANANVQSQQEELGRREHLVTEMINDVQAMLDDLLNQKQSVDHELSAKTNSLLAIEDRLNERDQEIRSREAETQSIAEQALNQRRIEIEQQQLAIDQRHAELSERAAQLSAENRRLRQQRSAATTQHNQIQASTHELEARQRELAVASEERTRLENAQQELTRNQRNVSELEARLTEQRNALERRESALLEQESELSDQLEQWNQQQQEYAARQIELSEREETIASRFAELSVQRNNVSAMQTELDIREDALSQQLNELDAQRSMLQSERQTLNDERREADEFSLRQEQVWTDRETELDQREKSIIAGEEDLRIEKEDIDRERTALNEQQSKIDTQQVLLDERQDELTVLIESNQLERNEIAAQKEQLQSDQAASEESRQQVAVDQQEVEISRNVLDIAQQGLDEARTEFEHLRAEFDQDRDELDQAQLEFEQRREEWEQQQSENESVLAQSLLSETNEATPLPMDVALSAELDARERTLEEEQSALEQKLKELDEHAASLQSEREAFQQQVADWQQQTEAVDQSESEDSSAVESVLLERERLQELRENLENEREELSRERRDILNEKEELDQVRDSIEELKTNVQEEQEAFVAERTALISQRQFLEDREGDLEAREQTVQQEEDNYSQRLNGIKEQEEALSEQSRQLEEEREQIQEQALQLAELRNQLVAGAIETGPSESDESISLEGEDSTATELEDAPEVDGAVEDEIHFEPEETVDAIDVNLATDVVENDAIEEDEDTTEIAELAMLELEEQINTPDVDLTGDFLSAAEADNMNSLPDDATIDEESGTAELEPLTDPHEQLEVETVAVEQTVEEVAEDAVEDQMEEMADNTIDEIADDSDELPSNDEPSDVLFAELEESAEQHEGADVEMVEHFEYASGVDDLIDDVIAPTENELEQESAELDPETDGEPFISSLLPPPVPEMEDEAEHPQPSTIDEAPSEEGTHLRSELAELFGISADELQSRQESSQPAEAESDSHQPEEDSLVVTPASETMELESAPEAADSAPEETVSEEPVAEEPAEKEPDSIASYMEQLLERTRQGSSSSNSSSPKPKAEKPQAAPSAVPAWKQPGATANVENVPEETPEEPAEPRKKARKLNDEEREAIRANLDSFRELANHSARSAVETSQRRVLRQRLKLLSGASACTWIATLILAAWAISQGTFNFAAAILVGIIAVGLTIWTAWTLLHKEQAEADEIATFTDIVETEEQEEESS